ncbi:MAG: hypothetical protein P8Y67_08410 [Alphaproteobacteria bacterium]
MFTTRLFLNLGMVCISLLAAGLVLSSTAEAGKRRCVHECYEQVPAPVIHRTYKYRVLEKRGRYEIKRKPSRYGWVKRRVMVKRPAIYRTVTVRRKLPARFVWEKRWVDGRYIKCKVRVPGKIVERTKRVLVSRARYVPTGEYVEKRILLKPYKNISVYHRARHRYMTRRVAIQPEGYVWRPFRHR